MIDFQNAVWIWRNGNAEKDEYVDFYDEFEYDGLGTPTLAISADSEYSVWLNGELVSFGQYGDYPVYKIGDTIDLTPYVKTGTNRLAVTVWYYGENTQTYVLANAGLIYEVTADSRVLAASSPKTLSRLSRGYVCGECTWISGQLGFTYHFNNQTHDGFPQTVNLGEFTQSRTQDDMPTQIEQRPIKRLRLDPRLPSSTVQQGFFSLTERNPHVGKNMQAAALAPLPAEVDENGTVLSSQVGDGVYLIVDLGSEQVGFLDFEIETDRPCRIEVGYGEHLADGRCRTGIRNFSCVFDAKAGENRYLNTFRRFGCRYLQFFIYAPWAKIRYAGLRPTRYPLTYREPDCGNLLRDTIWRVCQNTLDCCMHVHYEDCPWREQALYTLDSRNQMLCGYYAFGEAEFARASLKLISYGMRTDGLLSLCYPAGSDLPIPAFSLVYLIQMREYIDHTSDISLARECFSILTRLLSTFEAKTCENGLIENFYDKEGTYWNFYEWTPTMKGFYHTFERRIEAPLNAFYSLALQNMARICDHLGKSEDAAQYLARAERLNQAIAATFFETDSRLFRSFEEKTAVPYSVLTNSLCLLCGAADQLPTDRILKVLTANGAADTGLEIHENTLSMNCFRFDALLRTDRDAYREMILDEIDRLYLSMLRQGATSFWETELGEKDFGGSGSLCHGWSALPIYYYATLIKAPKE